MITPQGWSKSVCLLALISLSSIQCSEAPIDLPTRGPEWVHFAAPAQPLRSNRINCILSHTNGQVWIGTDSGAAYFQHGAWGIVIDSLRYTEFTPAGPRIRSRVTGLAQGKDGSVWFGTGGGGVKRYLAGTLSGSGSPWISYAEPVITMNVITSASSDFMVHGDVWVGTPILGLSRFIPSGADPREGDWVSYTTAEIPELGSNQIKCLGYNFNDQTIWVSTPSRLVEYRGELAGWRPFELPPQYLSSIIAMAVDLSDNVWAGKDVGLSRLTHERSWVHYTPVNTGGVLPPGRVGAVATDLRNVRWFGTDEGLVRNRDTTWQRFTTADIPELASDTITALSYDLYGNLWIGTPAGITVHNPEGTDF